RSHCCRQQWAQSFGHRPFADGRQARESFRVGHTERRNNDRFLPASRGGDPADSLPRIKYRRRTFMQRVIRLLALSALVQLGVAIGLGLLGLVGPGDTRVFGHLALVTTALLLGICGLTATLVTLAISL